MHLLHCPQPLPPLESVTTAFASNQASFHEISACAAPCESCTGNVRLMRRSKDQDGNRFALSGKLADVCAALDALAAQETRNARRIAAH